MQDMKARLSDAIRTTVDIQSDFCDRVITQGAIGTVVECYDNPEGYAVDLAIPNQNMVGGFEYENVVLFPHQFDVCTND